MFKTSNYFLLKKGYTTFSKEELFNSLMQINNMLIIQTVGNDLTEYRVLAVQIIVIQDDIDLIPFF